MLVPAEEGPGITDAVRAERERIALELHDGVIQSLYALGLGLEATIQTIEGDVPLAQAQLIRSRDSINNIVAEIRAYVVGLGSASGPAPTPPRRSLASRFAVVAGELSLDVRSQVSPQVEHSLPPVQAQLLYQIGREALRNVAKHARATRVEVSLVPLAGAPGGRSWIFQVRDNGVGFDASRGAAPRSGLRAMRDRARSLGGSLTIASRPGQGTEVRVVHV
jgi:signal transduction histidine kinase